MLAAKISIWTGALIALFGTDIPTSIFFALGVRPFPDSEINHFAITLGICLLTGGIVAVSYERDRNPK